MSLEPLYEYIVEVTGTSGNTMPVLTVANTKYHAREKVYKKLMHIQPDLEKYKMGVKSLAYKGKLHSLN